MCGNAKHVRAPQNSLVSRVVIYGSMLVVVLTFLCLLLVAAFKGLARFLPDLFFGLPPLFFGTTALVGDPPHAPARST